MDFFSLLISIFLAILSVFLIAVLLNILWASLFGYKGGWIAAMRLRSKEAILRKADNLLEQGKYVEAGSLLRQAFLLEIAPASSSFADRLATHHIAILERLVTMSDHQRPSLENLPVIEELLALRAALLKQFYDNPTTKFSIWPRSIGGKVIPGWAMEEYTKKKIELIDRLKTNRRSLESELERLFLSLKDKTEDVVFH